MLAFNCVKYFREGCSPETNLEIDAARRGQTNGTSKVPPLQSSDFVPHVARIHKLIQTRVNFIF